MFLQQKNSPYSLRNKKSFLIKSLPLTGDYPDYMAIAYFFTVSVLMVCTGALSGSL